jgi:hypothetical protein
MQCVWKNIGIQFMVSLSSPESWLKHIESRFLSLFPRPWICKDHETVVPSPWVLTRNRRVYQYWSIVICYQLPSSPSWCSLLPASIVAIMRESSGPFPGKILVHFCIIFLYFFLPLFFPKVSKSLLITD